jgi:hypothetical protein
MAVQDAHVTRKVLEGIVNRIVMGFHLDESAGQFELVCESPDTIAGAHRAFVYFRFVGVKRFKRTQPRHGRAYGELRSTYVACEGNGSWCVDSVRTAKPSVRRAVSIEMTLPHGGIELECDDVSYENVQLYAKPAANNDWTYFEVGTDRPVEVDNPFRCAWADVG